MRMASLWHQDGQGGWIEVKKAGGAERDWVEGLAGSD